VIAAVNDGTARAALGGCESAIELIEQGFEADVHYAFDWDCSEAVPVIRRPARHFTAATA
jgi:phosphosulfolactate phosphohydrolase-like enzyme